jgi:hypothetical protein
VVCPAYNIKGTCLFFSVYNVSFTAAKGLVKINKLSILPGYFQIIIRIDGISHAKPGLPATPEFKKPGIKSPSVLLMLPFMLIVVRVYDVSVTKRGEPAFYAESIKVHVVGGFVGLM